MLSLEELDMFLSLGEQNGLVSDFAFESLNSSRYGWLV